MRERDARLRLEGHLLPNGQLKRGYPSKAAAKRGLRRAGGPIRKDDLMVYRCRHCPNYHIGHKREAERAAG